MQNEELFETIKNIRTYQISKLGNIRNRKTKEVVKQLINKGGYKYVELIIEDEIVIKDVHRLVALQFIENPENKEIVDHKNNVRTNNNVDNLRWATHSENCFNTKIAKNNTSTCKGVYFSKRRNNYYAQIGFNNKIIHLGSYKTFEEAKKVRQEKAAELFGEFLNESEK